MILYFDISQIESMEDEICRRVRIRKSRIDRVWLRVKAIRELKAKVIDVEAVVS